MPPQTQRRTLDDAQPRMRTRRSSGRGTRRQILRSSSQTDPDNVRDRIMDELTASTRKYESQAIIDPFTGAYGTTGELSIENPPYNLKALALLLDRSNMLKQCVDAYVANIEATGHTFQYVGPEDQEDSAEAQAELARLEALTEQPNGDYDLLEFRERNRRDYEVIGALGVEVMRDALSNIMAYYNIPTHTLRLTKRDRKGTEVKEYVNRDGKSIEITRVKYFRRIVQEVGSKRVYFKEFGDPRIIDPETGAENASLSLADSATELIYVPQYRSGYAYGVPRYIHQLPSILGSREAELVNLQFFKENAIPAMAVLVSGGSVTPETIEDVEDYFMERRGRDAHNSILFIEALGDQEAADEHGKIVPPRMELKPLANERQNDAVFNEYDTANQKKMRSAFRLNPIFLGLSDDMTYATASSSLQMTEAQVFAPERNKVDQLFNMRLLTDADGRPPTYWRMRSNPPRFVNAKDVISSLPQFEEVGAMTPNIAIGFANEHFGTSIAPITEAWGDLPYSVIKEVATRQGIVLKGFEDLIGSTNSPTGDEGKGTPGDDGNTKTAATKGTLGEIRDRPRGVQTRPRSGKATVRDRARV